MITLDLVIAPDRRHARKDEDEFEAVIDAWGSPFCDGWENFTPDPVWPVPVLPERYGDRPRIDG